MQLVRSMFGPENTVLQTCWLQGTLVSMDETFCICDAQREVDIWFLPAIPLCQGNSRLYQGFITKNDPKGWQRAKVSAQNRGIQPSKLVTDDLIKHKKVPGEIFSQNWANQGSGCANCAELVLLVQRRCLKHPNEIVFFLFFLPCKSFSCQSCI